MIEKRRGVSLIEINIALLLASLMLLALYASMVSSVRLSQRDAVLTQAVELAQGQVENLVLSARNRNQFYLLQDTQPAYIGDYNGNSQYYVCVQTVKNLVTNPGDFSANRIKKVTVQIFLAQPGSALPVPVGNPLIQLSTVVTTL